MRQDFVARRLDSTATAKDSPHCWGTDTFSTGLEKSATFAREMPHLKVGAQK